MTKAAATGLSADSPRGKKRTRIEEPIHVAVLNLLKWQLPSRAVIHHSPNEQDQGGKQAMLLVKKAKMLGMRPGWPDLEWLLDGKLYFFEVKAPGESPSKEQRELHVELRAAGALVAVVHSVAEALQYLREWGLIRRAHG